MLCCSTRADDSKRQLVQQECVTLLDYKTVQQLLLPALLLRTSFRSIKLLLLLRLTVTKRAALVHAPAAGAISTPADATAAARAPAPPAAGRLAAGGPAAGGPAAVAADARTLCCRCCCSVAADDSWKQCVSGHFSENKHPKQTLCGSQNSICPLSHP